MVHYLVKTFHVRKKLPEVTNDLIFYFVLQEFFVEDVEPLFNDGCKVRRVLRLWNIVGCSSSAAVFDKMN